jgi:hypothetical protein
MKSLKLNITFSGYKAGDVVPFEDRIARHFIAKGWGSEVEIVEETDEDVPQIKPKKVKK